MTSTLAAGAGAFCALALFLSGLDSDLAVDRFRPSVAAPAASLAVTRVQLAKLCPKVTERRIDPPFIVLRQHVKREQRQLDCDGLRFQGAARWAEFIFADDSLQMVWIMTSSRDQEPLLQAMTREYGEPTHRNAKFIAFAGAHAALRTDVPEVLFYSPLIAPDVEGWFAENSTFR